MFLTIFLILWGIYAVYIVRYMRQLMDSYIEDYKKLDPALPKEYTCLSRDDMHRWNRLEIYFCAVFLLPLRIAQFFGTIIIMGILIRLTVGDKPANADQSVFTRKVVKSVLNIFSVSLMTSFGYFNVKKVKLNLCDVDPTYPKDQKSVGPAPIVVSNHVSWFDTAVFMNHPAAPSFMGKAAIEKYPLFGPIAKGIQGLFVDSFNKNSRDGVMDKLRERIDKFNKNPECVAPIAIFPEGTTSNHKYILSFKKGAFCNLTPVHVVGLKYGTEKFNPGFDSIGMIRGVLFLMCHFSHNLTVYDLGVFNPAHLNLKGEEDWKIYADKIKEILLKVLDLKSCEHGFADSVMYYNKFWGGENLKKVE